MATHYSPRVLRLPRNLTLSIAIGVVSIAAVALPASASAATCTTTATSASGAASKVARARAGAVVCLRDGSYGDVDLSATKSKAVTLRAAHPGRATIGDVSLRGRGLRLSGFVVHGQVTIEHSASNIAVVHNDISQGSFGVFVYGDGGTVSGVTIASNRITGAGFASDDENDLIRLHDFRGVRVIGNELSHIAETGGHSDILQVVHGGAGLVIARNYVHDQNGTQGFFVKDGAVTNLTLDDNLIVGDPKPNGFAISFYEASPNRGDPFYTGHGALVRRNTIADDSSGIAIRGCDSQSVLVERNVAPSIGDGGDDCGSWKSIGNVTRRAGFVDKRKHDYRLRSGKAGVTWRPGTQHYGP